MTWMTAPKSVPCSTTWQVLSPRSPATARTTRKVSTPAPPRATLRHPAAAIIVPPRATAVPSQTAASAPTQRDRHLQLIAERGRRAWQKASGYTTRARAETAISRFKRVIGDELRSHTEERRATEMDVAVHVLNRMLDLGRPT